jgi:hypothetical protein
MKNGFRPQVTTLEGREQPGSMFSTGLDASILAAGVLGEAIVQSSRPLMRTTQAPKKAEAAQVAVQPLSKDALDVQSSGTIKQTDSTDMIVPPELAVPAMTAADYAKRRPGVFGESTMDTRSNLTLFYGGNFDGRNGLANEFNTLVTDARTYDDWRIRSGFTIDCLFSRNLMTGLTSVTQANWSIRGPGVMSTGNGLAVFASGTAAPATQVPTGFSGFGLIEYEIKVCGLNLNVPSGHYYINVQPIGFGSGRSFQSTTSGAGPVKGQPIANGDTWFDSPYYGASFVATSVYFGAGTWDFSGGAEGTLP